MGSGHTGRGGRGGANRRSRRGPQRPGSPQGQNGGQRPAQLTGAAPAPASLPEAPSSAERAQPLPFTQRHDNPPNASERTERETPGGEGHSDTHHGDQSASRQARPERRGPQLVPSTTGPLPSADRPADTRPDRPDRPDGPEHHQPTRPADAYPRHGAANGGSGPGMGGRPAGGRDASERNGNGHFVVVDRAPRFDSGEADAADDEAIARLQSPRRDVRGDVGSLIDSLREVFERDRSVASQGGTARCGICYLHFPVAELDYHAEEGFYVCAPCAQRLGSTHLPMIRRQQR